MKQDSINRIVSEQTVAIYGAGTMGRALKNV